MANHKFKKKAEFKFKSRYHSGKWLSQKTYKYVILWGNFKNLEYYKINDLVDEALSDGAGSDAVYKINGRVVNGHYQAGRWVCLWELPMNHEFIKYMENNQNVVNEITELEQRA